MKSLALASARRTCDYVRLLERHMRRVEKDNARLRAEAMKEDQVTEQEQQTIADIRARQQERARSSDGYSEAEHDLALLLGMLDQQAKPQPGPAPSPSAGVFFEPPKP